MNDNDFHDDSMPYSGRDSTAGLFAFAIGVLCALSAIGGALAHYLFTLAK